MIGGNRERRPCYVLYYTVFCDELNTLIMGRIMGTMMGLKKMEE